MFKGTQAVVVGLGRRGSRGGREHIYESSGEERWGGGEERRSGVVLLAAGRAVIP